MTELSPVSHLTPAGGSSPASVGVTVPNTEMRIVDPLTGEDLGPRPRRGGLGPRPAGDAGLPQQPRGHRATIDDDGWLHTGDIGHLDADGHLYVVDRLKELIKYKGFQVAAGRAGGDPADPPGDCRRGRDRPARRGGRRDPGGYVVLKPSRRRRRGDPGVRGRPGGHLQAARPSSSTPYRSRRPERSSAASSRTRRESRRPRDAPPQRRPVEACTMSAAPDRRAPRGVHPTGDGQAQLGSNSLREHR